MKSTTYLNALMKAVSHKSSIVSDRPKRVYGIAVDKDQEAILWQRLDRQAKKFERKLRSRIGNR